MAHLSPTNRASCIFLLSLGAIFIYLHHLRALPPSEILSFTTGNSGRARRPERLANVTGHLAPHSPTLHPIRRDIASSFAENRPVTFPAQGSRFIIHQRVANKVAKFPSGNYPRHVTERRIWRCPFNDEILSYIFLNKLHCYPCFYYALRLSKQLQFLIQNFSKPEVLPVEISTLESEPAIKRRLWSSPVRMTQ